MFDAPSPGRATLAPIGRALLESFTSETAIAPLLEKLLRILRLVDASGQLVVPELRNRGLLDPFDPAEIVERVVADAGQNAYLCEAIRSIRSRGLPISLPSGRAEVLRLATCYGVLLERMTRLFREDWRIIRALRLHWRSLETAEQDFTRALTWFGRAKVRTMEYVIDDLLRIHESGVVPASWGRAIVSLNILEAGADDALAGYVANARTSILLARTAAGLTSAASEIHAGPARFSADRQAIRFSPPLPRQWMDLYVTWNLAFCATFEDAPFFFAKLLIPRVIGSWCTPEEFVYNRALALYVQVYYGVFTRIDRSRRVAAGECDAPLETCPTSWRDRDLTVAWGEANLTSSRHYAASLASRPGRERGRRSPREAVTTRPEP